MDLKFQILDCDYVLLNGSPTIRIFGRTQDNKSVCLFYNGHYPYFYVLPKDGREEELIDLLKQKFINDIKNLEFVEKFLPIGYQENKTKLIKITLFDPSKTPKIRDFILDTNLVEDVYEADILYKYRFMADANLYGMKWYKAIGKATKTNSVKTDQKIEVQKMEEAEDMEINFKILCVDIEIIHSRDEFPDPKKNPIAIISLGFYPEFNGKKYLVLISKKVNNSDTIYFQNEKEMLEKFLEILDDFDPDLIIGYNINNFDLPYILERLSANKLPKNFGRCNIKPVISKKIESKYKSYIPGRIVVDVYDLIRRLIEKETQTAISFSKSSRLKRYSLGDVALEFLGEGKLEIDHGMMMDYWNNVDKINHLINYAKKDVELTLKLFFEKKLLDKYIELSKLSGLLLQDVLDSGESARVENLLLREFNREDYVIPCKPSSKEKMRREEERISKGLKGALVLEPEIGLYTEPVIYLDFKSMYPSIYINYNICTTTLLKNSVINDYIKTPYGTKFVSKSVRVGIIPRILERLIKERDEVKKLMKVSKNDDEKRILDARQFALKTMANAFYGYTGYIRARFYILDIANSITSCGRDLIQRTKEIAESDKRFKVIYGDTDSIMIKVPTKDIEEAFSLGKEIEEKINKQFTIFQIKTESVFKSLLILAKKRYAGLQIEKENGSYKENIIMKGIETVRRDWCDLASKTLYAILDILLKEQQPKKAVSYIKEVISKLENNEIPIEDLIITKSISKTLKEYKGVQPHIELVKKMKQRNPSKAPAIGDRIGYVIIQGNQLVSERAEDPEYVKEKGLKIDSKYYIESQVLPPLERVFEAIGISKSEIFGIGKQLQIFEALKNGIKNNGLKIVESLQSYEKIVCMKCREEYERPPLIGKCVCGGDILFYDKSMLSKSISL